MTELQIKAAVRARDGYRCTECGLTQVEQVEQYGRDFDVHRVEPGSRYTVDGCVTLCRRCHLFKPKTPVGECRPGHARKKVSLTPEHSELLAELATRHGRPFHVEFHLAVRRHLAANGMVSAKS